MPKEHVLKEVLRVLRGATNETLISPCCASSFYCSFFCLSAQASVPCGSSCVCVQCRNTPDDVSTLAKGSQGTARIRKEASGVADLASAAAALGGSSSSSSSSELVGAEDQKVRDVCETLVVRTHVFIPIFRPFVLYRPCLRLQSVLRP